MKQKKIKKEKRPNKLRRLLLIEFFFIFIMGFFVGFGQFMITVSNYEEQIESHLKDIQKSIDKFDVSEDLGKKNVDDLLQIRANAMAWILKENIFSPNEDSLQQYAAMLDVEHIYVTDTSYMNIVSTKGARRFNVLRLTKGSQIVQAEVGHDRIVVLEMSIEYLNDTFKEAFSWQDSIKNIVVGRRGNAFMVEKATSKISLHSDDNMLRQEVHFWGLSQEEFLKEGYGLFWIGDTLMYGGALEINDEAAEAFPISEEYIVCAIPVDEIARNFFSNGIVFMFVFLAITILFVVYCLFEDKYREKDSAYLQKLVTYPLLGVFTLVVVSAFLSQINGVSSCMLNCSMGANDAASTIEYYTDVTDRIQEIYNDEYLIECRIAADILKRSNKFRSRSGMRELSALLNVANSYLFDKNGKVIVTDSLFDHFELSENEKDQSYAFRPLL
ncbi:MAG: hypothetical protein IJ679_01495, partial [Lachnospiraceae bacterium]|nr:hypothetical protein [Lachnospiraceae bacterium]